ncbi:MAG: fibro-slime domain-containing protein [Chitinivibrionales bacterium]|nr:fibro-slime domain-containing protein [Chitinivibrionales bacterium]MBD3395096.1 fibro-slime domain-containing protein [Chitinivibrionales bacterium]
MGRSLVSVLIALALLPIQSTHAAQGDTLWVKVTLYDFKGDSTNPDFVNFDCDGTDLTSGVKENMVQETLGSDGKPLKGTATYCSNNIEDWYRPSGATGATYNDSTHKWSNLVPYKSRDGEYVGSSFNTSAQMANVVIYDSLPFLEYKHAGYAAGDYVEGTYLYDNQAFFRVDSLGFVAGGEETAKGPYAGCCGASSPTAEEGGNSAHNFGFTMELHQKFTYIGGEYFEFSGDDDVWVFIDGKLALDLGGVHDNFEGTFYLDDLADQFGLVKGQVYQMDFFYAERMITQSHIRITTNIITSVPQRHELEYPEQIPAGDTADITATLYDQFGIERDDLLPDIEWTILNDTVPGDTLTAATGGSTGFVGQRAGRTVTVQATYWIDKTHNQKLVSTAEIEIVPGAIHMLRIEDANYNAMPDTLTLQYPDGEVTLYSTAYDKFNNRIGRVASNWTKSGSLHPITDGDSTSQILYQSGSVQADEAGDITATSTANPAASDYIYISILGPKVNLSRVVTRDYSGNGYLDAFELHFTRKIEIPDTLLNDPSNIVIYDASTGVRVEFEETSFKSTDSSNFFVLYVSEKQTNVPQTDWLPYITFSGHEDVQATPNLQCEDGAGPVIWSVTKTVSSVGDRSKDKVTVVFSEDFDGDGGEAFEYGGTQPDIVFNVWTVNVNGDTILIDSMLVGINAFSNMTDNALQFYMTNNNDLTGRNWMSIETSPKARIEDTRSNDPNDNNQRVRVIVEGDLGPIQIGPNPMYPIYDHFEEELSYRDPDLAFAWARDEGGAVMVAEVLMPDSITGDFRITGVLMTFDAVGNLAYSMRNDNDIIPQKWRNEGWDPGEQRQLVFYWNGITNDNRKAAPGIYRAIIYLDTQTKQQKFIGNVGIGR